MLVDLFVGEVCASSRAVPSGVEEPSMEGVPNGEGVEEPCSLPGLHSGESRSGVSVDGSGSLEFVGMDGFTPWRWGKLVQCTRAHSGESRSELVYIGRLMG